MREAAARSSSSNNLSQFGKGFHNFESGFLRLPPALGGTPILGAGTTADHPNWLPGIFTEAFQTRFLNVHVFVLPFMESDPLYNDMHVKGMLAGEEVRFAFPTARCGPRGQAYKANIKTYFSPADPSVSNGLATNLIVSKANCNHPLNPNPSGPPSGATSYAANFKVFGILNKAETAVNSFDRASTIANIFDGSSNVIFMAEKYGVCAAPSASYNPTQPTYQGLPASGGSLWAEPNLNENSPFFAYPQGGNSTYTAGPGLKFQTQPNPFNAKCNPYRAGTPHVGGILCLMGDGQVRTVAPSISDLTWYRAVTPDDGEKLGDDW